MITALLIAFTLAWSLVAFGLFVGADNLAARLRGREATFEWFDRTRWSGTSTPGRRATTWAAMGLAAVFLSVIALLVLVAITVSPFLPDQPDPRPPAGKQER